MTTSTICLPIQRDLGCKGTNDIEELRNERQENANLRSQLAEMTAKYLKEKSKVSRHRRYLVRVETEMKHLRKMAESLVQENTEMKNRLETELGRKRRLSLDSSLSLDLSEIADKHVRPKALDDIIDERDFLKSRVSKQMLETSSMRAKLDAKEEEMKQLKKRVIGLELAIQQLPCTSSLLGKSVDRIWSELETKAVHKQDVCTCANKVSKEQTLHGELERLKVESLNLEEENKQLLKKLHDKESAFFKLVDAKNAEMKTLLERKKLEVEKASTVVLQYAAELSDETQNLQDRVSELETESFELSQVFDASSNPKNEAIEGQHKGLRNWLRPYLSEQLVNKVRGVDTPIDDSLFPSIDQSSTSIQPRLLAHESNDHIKTNTEIPRNRGFLKLLSFSQEKSQARLNTDKP